MDDGAHYYKSDLQVHTPRDPMWSGTRPTTPEERSEFAARLVKACRDKALQAIAVSDHHDLAFFEVVREAAAAEVGPTGEVLPSDQRLVVFPGVELTLAVPCQALLILDADFPSTHLAKVLDLLSIAVTDPAVAQAAQPDRVGHITSLRQLQEELDRHDWLRGSFIVLPNVTDSGHGTLLRAGMQQNYIDMPCVGGYIDGDVENAGTGTRSILAGEDAAWGSKAIAVVQTSDARDESFDELGANPTWIKWAAPTAEALRQAFLAKESRVAHSEPDLPNVVVTRLSVSNSRFMGPIELEFNPQYNAIIGGRGTGKSTCLEYIRWALCDQPGEHQPEDETPDHAARRQLLIANTLAELDAHVEVHLLVNGIPHVVRRHAKTGELLLKVGENEMRTSSPDDVRGLLAIQAYSQKQLSSVGVRLDELSRFVTSPITEELDVIAFRQADVAARTRENFVVVQRQRTLARSTTRDELLVESLGQQASSLRDSLEAVSPEDRKTLAQKTGYDAADELIASWIRRLEEVTEAASEFEAVVSRASPSLPPLPEGEAGLPHLDVVMSIEGALQDILKSLEETAIEAGSRVKQSGDEGGGLSALLETWRQHRADFDREYAAAAERSTVHGGKLEELAALERRRSDVQTALEEQREELARLEDAAEKHANLREEWRQLQSERADAIEAQCRALTELSDELIRARVKRSAGLEDLKQRLKAAVSGSGVRGNKIEGFADQVAQADDPVQAWHHAMDQLEIAVLTRDDPSATSINGSALAPFTSSDVEKMAARLSPEAVLELGLIPMRDHPSFEYRTKEREYISFQLASAGQQATALLRVLLGQAGPPLVVDQPEDDLDSQVMLEVVDQIWEAKRRRQLIFSSHNANLVVNGDAELVICCDYRAAGDQSGAQIKLRGAIDIPSVRHEITVVMEGGEKAFRLRKEKYGF